MEKGKRRPGPNRRPPWMAGVQKSQEQTFCLLADYGSAALPLSYPAMWSCCGLFCASLTEQIWTEVIACHFSARDTLNFKASFCGNSGYALYPLVHQSLRYTQRLSKRGLGRCFEITFQFHLKTIAMLLLKCNSGSVSNTNSAANTIASVGTRRRPLTKEQEADAKRLNALWLRQKRALGLTQEQVAADCGWNTQAAFSQYLLGRIPLNLKAALKISAALQVNVYDFSPRLAMLLPATSFDAKEAHDRYLVVPEEKSEQESKRIAWSRLFDELHREGMSDAGMRLIRNLASELRKKKRDSAPKKYSVKKRA